MKISNNLLKYRYHFFRQKLIQPFAWLLIFLGPLLNVFRVDMIHQRLIFLGQEYPFEFQYLMWLPIGFYAAVVAVGLISFVWGRLFCGWGCPHNTMTEWTRALRAMVKREEKLPWMKRLIRGNKHYEELMLFVSPPLGIALTVSLSVLLSFYIVPPDWVAAQYFEGSPHIALVWGHGLFTLIGLFLLYAGHDFCRACCPYGMGQSISAFHEYSRWQSMRIRFTAEQETDCKTCTACQQVCPVDIDPRGDFLKVGQFDGCFNCGECIDACKYLHSFKQEPGLLSFNTPGLVKKAETPSSTP